MTHTHPFAVTVHVPTPEALHELSIFLQQFAHKYHGHHQSFAAETGTATGHHTAAAAVHHHQHTAPAAGADHYAGMGMPGAGAAAVQETIPSPQDVIALQKRLLESQVLTMPALMQLYAKLNINPVEQLQPHHCAEIHKHLLAIPGAR